MDRRELLADERGTLHKEAELRVALVYPSPYRAAMSSLGYQQIYRTLHGMPGVAADRAAALRRRAKKGRGRAIGCHGALSKLPARQRKTSGAGEKSRTPDLRSTNALLYQLSYAGVAAAAESRRARGAF